MSFAVTGLSSARDAAAKPSSDASPLRAQSAQSPKTCTESDFQLRIPVSRVLRRYCTNPACRLGRRLFGIGPAAGTRCKSRTSDSPSEYLDRRRRFAISSPFVRGRRRRRTQPRQRRARHQGDEAGYGAMRQPESAARSMTWFRYARNRGMAGPNGFPTSKTPPSHPPSGESGRSEASGDPTSVGFCSMIIA
jgi:hypothetical protein